MSKQADRYRASLSELAEKLSTCERIPAHLKWLKQEMRALREDLRIARNIVKKEERDVNKLRSASVNSIFPRFLKSRERQMEIELQEYVTAALKYNACLDRLEMMEFEYELLDRKLAQKPALQALWDKDMKELRSIIEKQHPEVAQELSWHEEQILAEKATITEVEEAISSGLRARRYLKSVSGYLEQISDWGHWTRESKRTQRPGKTSLVDKARDNAVRAGNALAIFEHELKDVFSTLAIADAFSLESFEHFLDTFHDNLVTDWIVQKHLRNSINNVEMAISKLNRFIGTLRLEKKTHMRQIKNLQKASQNLILTTP